MATYVYETIPTNPKERPRRFEVQQKMSDPALKVDPETGVPVRRVIIGGSGAITHGASILSMNVRGRNAKRHGTSLLRLREDLLHNLACDIR
jgi:hypothetical protein